MIGWLFAAAFGFGAVVEMAHCRFYLARRNWLRVGFTGAAAIAFLYVASEALQGDWPSL